MSPHRLLWLALLALPLALGCPTDTAVDDDDDSSGDDDDDDDTPIDLSGLEWRRPMDQLDPQGDNGDLEDLKEVLYRTDQEDIQIRVDFWHPVDYWNLTLRVRASGQLFRWVELEQGFENYYELVVPPDADPYAELLNTPPSMTVDYESDPESIIISASLSDLELVNPDGGHREVMTLGAMIPFQDQDAITDMEVSLNPPAPSMSFVSLDMSGGNGDNFLQEEEIVTLTPRLVSDGELDVPEGTNLRVSILSNSTIAASFASDLEPVNGGALVPLGNEADAGPFTLTVDQSTPTTGGSVNLAFVVEFPDGSTANGGTSFLQGS